MMKQYFYGNEFAKRRLLKEYATYKNLIIGFDFDNTVFDFHNEGLYIQPVINLLKECKKLGFTLCLYTLTPLGNSIGDKINHCIELGIEPDYVNTSPVLNRQQGPNPPKPYFNILLDDRAGLDSAYETLNYVVTLIKNKKYAERHKPDASN